MECRRKRFGGGAGTPRVMSSRSSSVRLLAVLAALVGALAQPNFDGEITIMCIYIVLRSLPCKRMHAQSMDIIHAICTHKLS